MKRVIAFLLLMTLCLTFWACAPKRVTEKGSQQVSSTDVTQILVRHFPESDGYTRNYTNPEKIKAVTDYVDGLTLDVLFKEDPDAYSGETWEITYIYKDGTEMVMYHFGNLFFRASGNEWRKMDTAQAKAFADIIWRYASDE